MGRRPFDNPEDAAQAAVTLAAGILAPGLALIGFASRLGFSDNAPLQWAQFVGLSWFLTQGAAAARRLLWPGRLPAGRWWAAHSSLSLAALALSAELGVESTTIARAAALMMFAIGTGGFALSLIRGARNLTWPCAGALVAFTVLFAFFGAGAAWGSGYQNPLFVEAMCSGTSQIDTLYHATEANMLRTYGVSSTGLDGLPFIPYHVGSHWLFGRMCNLLGVRIIDFYNRGYPIVFAPFGVYCLGTFAVDLAFRGRSRPFIENDDQRSPNETRFGSIGPAFWFVLAAGYIGLLPYAAGATQLALKNSIIISESYAVAVAVSLLGVASARVFFEQVADRNCRRPFELLFGFAAIALLMGVIGLLKISVMLVLAAVAAYALVRLRLHRMPVFWALAAAGALGTYGGYRLTANPGYGELSGFVPFGFVRANVDWQWWSYYWLIYYAWLWIAVVLRLREEGVRTRGDLASAWRERRLIDLELVAIAAIVGAAPGMLMTVYSSTYYFSDYQRWLALGLVLAIVVRGRQPSTQGAGFPIGRSCAAILVLAACGTFVSNTAVLLGQATASNLAARGRPSGQTGLGVAFMHLRFGEAGAILRQTASEVESRLRSNKNILSVLGALDEAPLSEKRQSLVFIPKTNRQFWDLLSGPYSPKDGPLVATALSGRAMIDGLHVPKRGEEWVVYGYRHYPRPDRNAVQPPLDRYLSVLRQRSATMGFARLIVIDNDAQGLSRARTFDCP